MGKQSHDATAVVLVKPRREQTQSPRSKRRFTLLRSLSRRSTASLSVSSTDNGLPEEQDEEHQVLIPKPTTPTSSWSKDGEHLINLIRSSVIGDRCVFSTPFGEREIVYADYTASGRALSFLEDYMMKLISPLYANTHTEASFTGAQTTHLREEARAFIHKSVNAPKDEYAVLFCGTGSTGAIDKLVRVLGLSIPEFADKKWSLSQWIPENERPVVFISHFEHHSNELIWREGIARVVVIDEDENGLPCLKHLKEQLQHFKRQRVPMIGSFSAGSNVTGIKSEPRALVRVLHKHGALAFFDYAGVGAYVDIDMKGEESEDCSMDAIFLSPHKFIGGPGAAGVLVAKRKLFHGPFGVPTTAPSVPGGGTVSFVSQYKHAYSQDIEIREDAGTPGIPQCIRAGLVFWLKDQVGSHLIENCEAHHNAKTLESWGKHPRIMLVGSDRPACSDPNTRVPIFSFNILSPVNSASRRYSAREFRRSVKSSCPNSVARQVLPVGCARMAPNKAIEDNAKFTLPLHQNFIIALLNDVYGIQGRGGCSCAGPYGHVLFGVNGENGKVVSETLRRLAVEGYEAFKPGWARVNLNYFVSDDEVNFILEAVEQIATHGWKLLPFYTQDLKSGKYTHLSCLKKEFCSFSMKDMSFQMFQDDSGKASAKFQFPEPTSVKGERDQAHYDKILDAAMQLYSKAEQDVTDQGYVPRDFTSKLPDGVQPGDVWWLRSSEAAKKLQYSMSSPQFSTRRLLSSRSIATTDGLNE